MNILITGGLGYIGGRLANHLAGQPGYKVTVTTRKNISETISYQIPSHIQIIHGVSPSSMEEAIGKTDIVIHLAALNEIDSLKRPLEAIQVNVLESFIVLESAIKHKVKKFIYFSTAHVYGAPLRGVITEKIIPRPVHPYALTHHAFEDFVTAARDNKKIDALVLRLSNSFGPPSFLSADRWTLLVNDLCREAVTKNQMTLKTAGLQQRDFISLLDTCRAVQYFIEAEDKKWMDGIFNLGGHNAMPVIDMANLIKERARLLFNKEIILSVPKALESEMQEDHFLQYDISKLLASGFSLKNNIIEEIDNTLLFCSSHFNQETIRRKPQINQ
ncbi:MAG TPA: SDR family oxidoreductase [Puia sp.]|nr:SDR family oxidoreductase [Puia sp.]